MTWTNIKLYNLCQRLSFHQLFQISTQLKPYSFLIKFSTFGFIDISLFLKEKGTVFFVSSFEFQSTNSRDGTHE